MTSQLFQDKPNTGIFLSPEQWKGLFSKKVEIYGTSYRFIEALVRYGFENDTLCKKLAEQVCIPSEAVQYKPKEGK